MSEEQDTVIYGSVQMKVVDGVPELSLAFRDSEIPSSNSNPMLHLLLDQLLNRVQEKDLSGIIHLGPNKHVWKITFE